MKQKLPVLFAPGLSVLLLAGWLPQVFAFAVGPAVAQTSGAPAVLLPYEAQLSGELLQGVRLIRMTAQRYKFTPKRLVVRSGEKIRLEIISLDTMHSFMLEGYGIDQKLPPRQIVTIEFTARTPGTVPFRCAVYCGPDHYHMTGELEVLAPDR